jgi:hypothetical protein
MISCQSNTNTTKYDKEIYDYNYEICARDHRFVDCHSRVAIFHVFFVSVEYPKNIKGNSILEKNQDMAGRLGFPLSLALENEKGLGYKDNTSEGCDYYYEWLNYSLSIMDNKMIKEIVIYQHMILNMTEVGCD